MTWLRATAYRLKPRAVPADSYDMGRSALTLQGLVRVGTRALRPPSLTEGFYGHTFRRCDLQRRY
ncbi:MAG: hypothetical protein NVS2B17_20070 [Candidatus Velthaea sp.]